MADKTVLIFGAGSVGEGWGNGKATSVAYAREGATVIAVDRDKAAADATASIITELGGRVSSYAADVTDSDGVKSVVGAVLAAVYAFERADTAALDRLRPDDAQQLRESFGDGAAWGESLRRELTSTV